jgi:hypothetical protein
MCALGEGTPVGVRHALDFPFTLASWKLLSGHGQGHPAERKSSCNIVVPRAPAFKCPVRDPFPYGDGSF